MTQKTSGRRRDNGLKQAREKGNSHLDTRKEVEGGSSSERAGDADRYDPGEETDQIVLSSFLAQARGVIGRYPEPDQEFVFEFDEVRERDVHMVGVRRPLQVEWYVDDDLVRVEELKPWTGYASAEANRVIERRPS
jgi:hypothetical protein